MRYPEIRAEPYDALARKFKREYEQLRGETDPRVVLLDATPFNANALTFDIEMLNENLGQSLLDKPKVSMLWILSRTWTTRSRFQHSGVAIFNRNAAMTLPRSFYDALGVHEHSGDPLTGASVSG